MTYVIGTAGHVDHGKSTLVQALTGIDPDRLAEEKAREMTIDLGFAWLTLPDEQAVGVVDVPGHRDFIENMLAGVGSIDLALLVIAADEGIMPQTREHLAILHLLDVSNAIVVLTKTDLVEDPEWLDLVTLDVMALLEDTRLAGAPVLPVSARTGAGLPDLITALASALAASPPRPDMARPRLPIDRVFTISGFGTVVTGTLLDGRLRVGDEVSIEPVGLPARVRGLQTHQESLDHAVPGSRVAVNLSGVATEDIRRGDVLTVTGLYPSTRLLDASFDYLPDGTLPLRHNMEVKFFTGAAEVLARVRLVGDEQLLPGETGWLQLHLEKPVTVAKGDRFILRIPSPAQTIGGGVILDSSPTHRWRRFKPEVLGRFETLASGTPEDLILQAVSGKLLCGIDDLQALLSLNQDSLHEAVAALLTNNALVELSPGLYAGASRLNAMLEQMLDAVRGYHAGYPLRPGMPREGLRSQLQIPGRAYPLLLNRLAEDGKLVLDGALVRLTGFEIRFSEAQQTAIDALLARMTGDPVNTPSIPGIKTELGEDVYEALVSMGVLKPVTTSVVYTSDTYDWLAARVREYLAEHGSITVAEARDLFGSTRKYMLALLEYLDAVGMTRRDGDVRLLR